MTTIDPLDEQKAVRLRQRLWGAAVLIALLVIFLPLLLDGSGSESQYRRVERLRAEPPRVLDENGIPETTETVQQTPEQPLVEQPEPVAETLVTAEADAANVVLPSTAESTTGSRSNSDNNEALQSAEVKPTVVTPRPKRVQPTASRSTEPLTAWVVQAGSFGDEANAVAVRDKLRRAGFPSFVTPSESATPMYRVRVGPMINLQQAEANRNKVMRLLDREAIVVSYP